MTNRWDWTLKRSSASPKRFRITPENRRHPKFQCRSLAAAVKAAAKFLNNAVKPVLVGGVKLRAWGAEEAFLELAEASGYPVAIQPHAKGLVPESHPRYIGAFWIPLTYLCTQVGWWWWWRGGGFAPFVGLCDRLLPQEQAAQDSSTFTTACNPCLSVIVCTGTM